MPPGAENTFATPKRGAPLGLHLSFKGCFSSRPILALSCTCANDSNHCVSATLIPTLLHVVAGTPTETASKEASKTRTKYSRSNYKMAL